MFDNVILSAAAEGTKDISIGDAAITAIFGYTVVFAGLVCLMILLYCTGAYFKSKNAKEEAAKKAAAEVKAAPVAAEVKADLPLAPGSAGHVKLFDVPDKEAAMIMAIVADKMQKPLNELHFISIKEVK
ncbi:MAG: OadG family protein [Ruminococcus sp.]|jgi:Na+-transporting methylmalonyl-CoA/oxaloacetate decarboxylase gamma subunit|uniref:OadG family transporter subunit n=1 Tax=Ruminococcus sp. TaxID=41978 RepID=UPI001B2A8561|nr:OadG family transporter subunit [Ruminococcus sp.]MBO7472419.1 OadG family protein [Ruminococcus sp.]